MARNSKISLIKDIIAAGVGADMGIVMTLSEISNDWAQLVGAALGARSAPKKLENGVLTVHTSSVAALTSLKFELVKIKKAIKEKYGLPLLDIEASVGSSEMRKIYPPRAKALADNKNNKKIKNKPEASYEEIKKEAENYTGLIEDEDLKISFAKAALAYKKLKN